MKMKPDKALKRSSEKRPSMIVVDKNGLEGTVVQEVSSETTSKATSSTGAEAQLLVRFKNGEQVIVPRELLNRQQDGRYHLALSMEELLANQDAANRVGRADGGSDGQVDADFQNAITSSADATQERPLVIPVTEERVKVETRAFETGRVELHKSVHERTEVVDRALRSEEVEIERVPINQLIEEPIPVRYEGDTTIVPLLEEIIVIEKRLVLREEVHIRKLSKEVHEPQEIRLREERVDVVRKPATGQAPTQGEARRES